MRREPALALVLHTHMPYVEGFGAWPFGEEWLWEAIATSYVPLAGVLDAWPGRVTLSLTPVLMDQLVAPGALERCKRFLREVRPATHALDLEADPALAAPLADSLARYAAAAEALGGLVERLRAHAAWTSAATHAVLPLLATPAGIDLQCRNGVGPRFPTSGFWLPECAYAPWLDAHLARAGVELTCVDLTDVRPGDRRPLRSAAGPVLVPLDREAIELVWSPGGYPARAAYADTHQLTERKHKAWAVDRTVYDPARGLEQAHADAREFVEFLASDRDGLVVCALDTELLGHWWWEGPAWLAAVLAECDRRGIAVAPLAHELVAPHAVALDAPLPVTSWGSPRDLSTWSGPQAGGLAWEQRRAELAAFAPRAEPGERALRELLALQSSDWAFLVTRGTAGEYPRERFEGHRLAFWAALADKEAQPAVRGLAPAILPASN